MATSALPKDPTAGMASSYEHVAPSVAPVISGQPGDTSCKGDLYYSLENAFMFTRIMESHIECTVESLLRFAGKFC